MRCLLVLLVVLLTLPTRAEDQPTWREALTEALTVSAPNGAWKAQVSGAVTLEAYRGHQGNPGLVFSESDPFIHPRLTLFLDAELGRELYAFVQARVDRGFDPGADPMGVRLDEYALRYTPQGRGISVQIGQFATVIGNWVARHDVWQNPFVGAPLPYEYLTGAYDERAPSGLQDLGPGAGVDEYAYLPVVWGPSYATGISLSGRKGGIEYAVELKNAGPSSRPDAWPITEVGFSHPAFSARLAYRPDLRLKLGLSYSDSTYLLPSAARTLPSGRRFSDYRQRLFSQEFSYEWRHLQVWAEAFHSSFDVPGGSARTTAGYVESRYKVTPQLFLALRWNRQTFSTIDAGASRARWGVNTTRYDLAAVYRFTPDSQFKAQVTSNRPSGDTSEVGVAYAVQYCLRF
ncbi:MAG: hypothetical protein JNN01_09890 [Opitutaceae bacterium]|nr:hypothetical protein [Opitutaceae bacterium]